jgi:hypothetical protein
VRKVPWLGDLPHLGFLFRYTQQREEKRELLIVMTPHIVRTDADAQRIKDLEVSRVNWILDEVGEMHGDLGLTPTEQDSDTTDANSESPAPPTDTAAPMGVLPLQESDSESRPEMSASEDPPTADIAAEQSLPAMQPPATATESITTAPAATEVQRNGVFGKLRRWASKATGKTMRSSSQQAGRAEPDTTIR